MEFHGISESFLEFLPGLSEIPWNSIDFPGIPWNSREVYNHSSFPTTSMEFHGIPWTGGIP
jgi:hypothetical protein